MVKDEHQKCPYAVFREPVFDKTVNFIVIYDEEKCQIIKFDKHEPTNVRQCCLKKQKTMNPLFKYSTNWLFCSTHFYLFKKDILRCYNQKTEK